MTYPGYLRIRRHSLADTLREHRRSRPELPVAVDGELHFDFPELDAQTNRLATALQARGIRPGDRLLWMGQNSLKVLELLMAAAKLGAVLCPINWRMTVPETVRVVADFDPKIVFWQDAEVGESSRAVRAADGGDRLWVRHDGNEAENEYDHLIESGEDRDDEHDVDPESPLLAIYTAGFSGQPNAAMLSHTAIMLQSLFAARSQGISETTRYLATAPMFHIGVFMGIFATFVSGGCCIIVARPEAEELLKVVDAERPTHAFFPAPLSARMRELNADGRYDVSSLAASNAMNDYRGGDLPVAAPAAAKKWGGYGQTEMMGMAVMTDAGGIAAGRPLPFVQVRIVDDAGKELPNGETGEIVVRGPMVMCGYYGRDDENAYRTELGWHRTRDLGKRLPCGSIAFVGPKSVLIKTGVENVYPAEVEACLRSHPAVADVCVIGVPDPTWDQNVKAVVVLKEGQTAAPEELIDHCRQSIASYKKPKLVDFVTALPRMAEGGIDRAKVDADHGGGGYPRSE